MRINHFLSIFAAFAICACSAEKPVKIIFDTDLGNDNDDAMALDILHKYVDAGKVDLLAVMCNRNTDACATLTDILNTWYGHPDIPIGRVKDGVDIDNIYEFDQKICDLKNEDGTPLFLPTASSPSEYGEPTSLYRKMLSESKDHSVTIVSVGYFTNVARLLESGPDEYSELNGVELVKKKVKEFSVMAGDFSERHDPEFNVICDIPSSKKFFELVPVPVFISPVDVGMAVLYPCSSIENDFNWDVKHPMIEIYVRYSQMPYDKCTFDLTSVLYAVEPELFTVGEPGDVEVEDDSRVTLQPNPEGMCRVLSVTDEQNHQIVNRFKEILTTKPAWMAAE